MSAFNELRTFAEPEITPNADVRPLGQDRLIRYRGSSLKEFFTRGSAERVARMGSSMTNNDGMSSVLAICGGIIFGALIDNMFAGLALGFVLAFGLIKWKRSKPCA